MLIDGTRLKGGDHWAWREGERDGSRHTVAGPRRDDRRCDRRVAVRLDDPKAVLAPAPLAQRSDLNESVDHLPPHDA